VISVLAKLEKSGVDDGTVKTAKDALRWVLEDGPLPPVLVWALEGKQGDEEE
jgi:hypothetical protein